MAPDANLITTLLALPPDLVERDRVRRQALRAGAVQHSGLAPLRSAAFAGDGLALTWAIPAGSGPMASGDDPIAVLAPVAAGLALLHDAGLAHGGVAGDAVYVSGGKGYLTGWRPGGNAPDDVAALVALLEDSLPASSVGADIVQILIAGADPDPAVRPSMARVAAALEGAARRSSPPISPPAHRRVRLDDALPPRVAEAVAATVPTRRTPVSTPSTASARARQGRLGRPAGPGRHAARRAPAGSFPVSMPRVPWRWGLALAGAGAVALLGLSAVGSSGSAQEICPVPTSAEQADSRVAG